MELAMKLVNKIMKLILWIKNVQKPSPKCPKFTLKCVGGWGFAPDPAWGTHNIIIKITLSHGTCCETS